jgi:protein-S-isoprenylcysteine O-methyltransferase Ste14
MLTPAAVAVFGVMAGWLAFGLVILPHLRRGRGRGERRSRRSVAGIVVQGAGFALVWGWAPIGRPGLVGGASTAAWILATGVCVLACASGAFAVAAVRTLGRQWSFVARVADAHRLVTTGPYAIVRHPIYTAMLGLLVATGLTLSSLPALLLAVVVYAIGTAVRVRAEEALLLETFGDEYRLYRGRVPAVLPLPRRGR